MVVPGSVDGGKEATERQPDPLRPVWVKRMHSTTTKNRNDGSIERSVHKPFY